MLIVCPNCSTSYAIDPTSLGSAGRIVRCARRKTTWFADGAKPEPELTAVEAETYAERAFTGVLRPDHPVNSSGVEVEHRPVVEEAGDSSVTQEHPVAAETPATIVDAPSGRGAAPPVRGARCGGTGGLHLNGVAGPQHSRPGRKAGLLQSVRVAARQCS
jgi:predicted Zn finger-like uncharacterized protein